MEQEMYLSKGKIDAMELLSRFILSCKNRPHEEEFKSPALSYADIVTAVYYYRKYPDPNVFINEYLKDVKDYFLLQWIRATWGSLSKMTTEEISDLVINQITLVANSEEAE